MKADYHVHSEFSDDSKELMESQIEQAISLGLDEICFTDHVDYGIKRDRDDKRGITKRTVTENGVKVIAENANVDYPEYFEKLDKMKKKYSDRIKVKSGLEFGVQTHTINLYEKLFERYKDRLDFILLSIHQVDNKEFWTGEFQEARTQREYNLAYYEELLRVVENYKDYSAVFLEKGI